MPHPKKKLILHIGCEKTGTTSIQHALQQNRNRLINQGFLYPESLGKKAHHLPVIASKDDHITDNESLHTLSKTGLSLADFRQQLLKDLHNECRKKEPWHTLIVSSELIHSRLHTTNQINRFFALFKGLVSEITIVIYLRRQDHLALSRFSSILKDGYSQFDGVFANIGAIVYPKLHHSQHIDDFKDYYNFQKLIERFKEHVTYEDIKISLHPVHNTPSTAIEEFSRLSGIPYKLISTSKPNLNSAMSAEAQHLITLVNKSVNRFNSAGLRNPQVTNLHREIEKAFPGKKREVTRHEADSFLKQFSKSNEWVRKKFFPEQNSLFDMDLSAYPTSINTTPFSISLKESAQKYVAKARKISTNEPLRAYSFYQIRKKLSRAKYYLRNTIRKFKIKCSTTLKHLIKDAYLPLLNLLLTIRHKYTILRCHASIPYSQKATRESTLSTFLLVRILGNDLPPRHSEDQTINNLKFILENEPAFLDCRKLFIINRIVEPNQEQKIISLLERYSAEFITIPFSPEKYIKQGLNTASLGGQAFLGSKEFLSLDESTQSKMRIWAISPKILYAMNVNGARNIALSEGKKTARWTFPLDGNCIFSQEQFEKLRNDCLSQPFVPYIIIKMLRLSNNNQFMTKNQKPSDSIEEPQMGFHSSAAELFDPYLPYGVMDKAALLKRLGLPGPWQLWGRGSYWMHYDRSKSKEIFQYKQSSCTVYRLHSGAKNIEVSALTRHKSRDTGIARSITELDERFSATTSDNSPTSQIKTNSTHTNKDLLKKLDKRSMFIGIGAMKSGTTWLSDYLKKHPAVYHSPIKEMNFFNTLVPGPDTHLGSKFRHKRIKEILTKKTLHSTLSPYKKTKLLDLTELDNLNKNTDAYLQYFGKRIQSEQVFGEISPSYARLPPQGYEIMSNLNNDTRIFFLMRDPVSRTISHFQHILRVNPTLNINEEINNLSPGNSYYERSNYMSTINAVKIGAPNTPFKTFVFEELFTEKAMRTLCSFLNIEYITPNFDKKSNASHNLFELDIDQKNKIREKLNPIYEEMGSYFGPNKSSKWKW